MVSNWVLGASVGLVVQLAKSRVVSSSSIFIAGCPVKCYLIFNIVPYSLSRRFILLIINIVPQITKVLYYTL